MHRGWRRSQSAETVVVVVTVMVVMPVSLVEGKGVDQRLALATVALFLLEDLGRLRDLLGDRLLLLPQRGDLDAAHANLVVPRGRSVGGHGGLVGKRQGRLGTGVGCLGSLSLSGRRRRGSGSPSPTGRNSSLQK